MVDGQLLAFVGVAVVLSITPGPDMAIVLRNVVRGGRAAGYQTIAGISIGLLVWASASALGLTALFAASATLFTVVKLAGALYLIYLGVHTLRSVRAGGFDEPELAPGRRASPFRQGLVTNLLNPKLALLFTTLLPQFISKGDPAAKSALLAAIFITIGLSWLCLYVLIVDVVARNRTFRRVTEAISGVVLVGLGVRLVFER